jgi:UDP-N-acetylglucosamine diphosphorylase / glucose-1-phosphate thymidylyltransferase / UDP-N-acetylgalactosamine diphosphorylase / glucosamine-1-phosphate N-acetyltransferase / galactosamine-1-phosphate N-acetyltransferase
MFRASDLFNLAQTEHAGIFDGCEFAWEALNRINRWLEAGLKPAQHGVVVGRAFIGEQVYIGEGTIIEDGAMIKGPAWIGRNCEIRHGAYVRENAIIGDGCVVGNACELKNALLFNEAVVPHFSYVGDSILGWKAHLGAGVKISNVKLVPGNVLVESDGRQIDTGLKKFGALIGDESEVGCNAVLNPGSILGRGSVVYPNTNWRGVLEAGQMAKNKAAIEIVRRRAAGSEPEA